MKKSVTAFLCLISLLSAGQLQTFHDFSAETIHGNVLDLSYFYGKKVLVVNTASYCAYTPQYAQLEALYLQYQDAGFEIVGFPCNDFGGQEPGSDSTILDFCEDYDVTFPMMSRVKIIYPDTEAVFRWLQRGDLNGVEDAGVTWNFNKFLIDEAGNYVKHFVSTVLPTDTAITNWIESPSVLTPTGIAALNSPEKVSCIMAAPGTMQLVFNETVSKTTVNVYSLDGRRLMSSGCGHQDKGMTVTFGLTGISSGIYIIRIEADNFTKSFKQAITQ